MSECSYCFIHLSTDTVTSPFTDRHHVLWGGRSINSSTVPLTIDGRRRNRGGFWPLSQCHLKPAGRQPGATVIVTASGACRRSASVKTRKKKEHWQRYRQLVCCRLQQPLPFLRALGKQSRQGKIVPRFPISQFGHGSTHAGMHPGHRHALSGVCSGRSPSQVPDGKTSDGKQFRSPKTAIRVSPIRSTTMARATARPSGGGGGGDGDGDGRSHAARDGRLSSVPPEKRGGEAKKKKASEQKQCTSHPSRHMICPARRRWLPTLSLQKP